MVCLHLCKILENANHSDRKQISDYLEEDWWEEWITEELREAFGNDRNAYCFDCSDGFTGICTPKLIKLKNIKFILCQLFFIIVEKMV